MTTITPEERAEAAWADWSARLLLRKKEWCDAYAAAIRQAEADALERAAKAAEDDSQDGDDGVYTRLGRKRAATAIRSLIPSKEARASTKEQAHAP